MYHRPLKIAGDVCSPSGDSHPHIPYGRQWIDEEDIAAVVEVLRSDWLTTGPKVDEFEEAFARFVGAEHAVAVSSGTAALHSAMDAIGIGPGDEVIVPPITFVATANCVMFQGGKPVFADVTPETLLLDPTEVKKKITPRTKAIIAVDYAGHPCDYDALRALARRHGLFLIADACHSLGAEYKGRKTGSLADLTVFSFHPVKHITTGEGGMITTEDAKIADHMRQFRNHGINTDHRQRTKTGSWFYEMVGLGFNYRITDIQCALGLSQLKKLPQWIKRLQELAREYDRAFEKSHRIRPLPKAAEVSHAYHLYVVKCVEGRDEIFSSLRKSNIGANVHYIPVHLHPFYRKTFGYKEGDYPVSESAYYQALSLPIFSGMTDRDSAYVIESVLNIMEGSE
jgi:perosamine synthetase